jgi:hypothetical protein
LTAFDRASRIFMVIVMNGESLTRPCADNHTSSFDLVGVRVQFCLWLFFVSNLNEPPAGYGIICVPEASISCQDWRRCCGCYGVWQLTRNVLFASIAQQNFRICQVFIQHGTNTPGFNSAIIEVDQFVSQFVFGHRLIVVLCCLQLCSLTHFFADRAKSFLRTNLL